MKLIHIENADVLCCDKKMVEHSVGFDNSKNLTCKECGSYIRFGQLDEEELEDFNKNYEEE